MNIMIKCNYTIGDVMKKNVKRGISLIISGVIFIIVGGLTIKFTALPMWVDGGLGLVSAIISYLGLQVVLPKTK